MLNRRRFAGLLGATAMGGLAAPALIRPSCAQGTAPLPPRGNCLIKSGAVMGIGMAVSERHIYDPQNGLPGNIGLLQAKPAS